MDKPTEFIISTHEKLSGTSMHRMDKLIDVILDNGFNIKKRGLNPEGKDFWIFTQDDNKTALTEEELKNIGVRTDEEWQAIGDRVAEEMTKHFKEQIKNKLK